MLLQKMEALLRPAFLAPFTETSLAKDLPRLASRIAITSPTLCLDARGSGGEEERTSRVFQVVSLLSAVLQPDQCTEVEELCHAYDQRLAEGADPQIACTELLGALGGDESPVVIG
uniref:Uncharacterized protein n=1 Tax=Rhizochromulina marina TaxID=1034831 RepID=A0A7S2SSP9_9STRA